MSNFSTATEATATALSSAGSAARENARYMESIEARVTAVNAAFQKMSTAVVDSDLVKGILDIVKAMAEFGSTDFGAAVTQFVLLSGLSWGGLQLLGQSILPSIMSSFGASEAVVDGFKAALGGSLPVILAITAAIVGLVAVVKAIKDAYDKANPSIEQASLQMKSAEEALKQTEDNYANAKQKLDELNATPYQDRTSEIQAEIEELETLVQYYETLLGIRKEESAESASKYVSSVEKNGLGVGQFQGTTQYSSYDNEGNLIYLTKTIEQYHSLTAAIRAAASAQYEIDKIEIDISDINKAQKQLERLGWSFEEVTTSTAHVQDALTYYTNTMNNSGTMTGAYIDNYNDLIALSEDYVRALEIQKREGIELTDAQESFLNTYYEAQKAYENYITTQAEEQGVTKEEIASRYEAASALSAYAQELINAANAYQIFKDRLSETGDYDDSFKGFSSILSEVVSEFDAGQIGSQKFLTGLELLTGQTFTSAEAVEYMNDNLGTLKLLFGDSESGGMGLITALEDLGYASLDANGNLQISIEDFGRLASELNISEGALYSLTEALRVMGVDFQYNGDSILQTMSQMGDGIVEFGDTTTVNFDKYVEAAKQAGMSNDEILAISNILSNVEGIELNGVAEGLNLIANNSSEAETNADELNSGLDDVGGAAGGIESAASSMSTLAENTSSAANSASSLAASLASVSSFKAPSLGNLIGGLFGHAKGTSHAKEGASLVNEEGPELIQSGDRAYIAGNGLPTVTQLHEGDIVYTADETQRILGGKKINGSIQSHRFETNIDIPSTPAPNPRITGATTSVASDLVSKLLSGVSSKGKNTSSLSSAKKSSSSSSSNTSKDYKAEFDAWLKAKKHALAMDEITEAEYYDALSKMNDKYFKGKKEYQDEYWKYQEQIYSWEKKQIEEKAKAEAKAYKNEFDEWLDRQNHALAMDEITQEEYYEALEKMNDQYFKDKEEYQEEYWKYEEKIYTWRKKQAEEEAKAQEQALKEQIELEKKLNNLAKAQASRVKVFQDGQFRYVSDRDALAKAQEALSGYSSGTYSATGGLSLVGENGAEMRVLNKGDGILPSNITKNLWGWGSLNPDFVLNKGSGFNNQNYSFDIDKLVLPDVNNAMSFVEGLKSFALQYSTQRG